MINGGLPRAKKEGVKLESGPPTEFKVSSRRPLKMRMKLLRLYRKQNIQFRLWRVMLLFVRDVL